MWIHVFVIQTDKSGRTLGDVPGPGEDILPSISRSESFLVFLLLAFAKLPSNLQNYPRTVLQFVL